MSQVTIFINEELQELIDEALEEEVLPEWVLTLLREIDTWQED